MHAELYEQIKASHGAALDAATQVEDKLERQDACKAVEEQVLDQYSGDPEAETYAEYRANAQRAFDKLEKTLIRERIAVQKKRPDGRSSEEIRPISIEVGVAPRTHGSALFTRGQTQALSVVALGTTREEMRLDTLGLETAKRYFHHYNFPPFSVGEAGFMRGPKRRDIGHGALAERALVPMIPSQEEFPYTIRVVSDILESNGSILDGLASAARPCRLMDAGVPIKRPVAGIAMGLIKEGDDYIILTDIAGVEDHLGDMDFKVAGTEHGITALQMDIKITGVTFEILRDALAQAKVAREFILGEMAKVIDAPRTRALQARAADLDDPDRPREDRPADRQGRRDDPRPPGGVRVPDRRQRRGQVLVYAADGERGDALVDRIRSMTKEVEVGDEFTGKVVKTTDVRRVHRALQGHRRAAAHLERRARPADRDGRGGPQQGRRAERARGRGRPRAWPDRPAPGRRPGGRRQDRRGARRRRQRRQRTAAPRPWPA